MKLSLKRSKSRLEVKEMGRLWLLTAGVVLGGCGTGGNPAGPSTQAPPAAVALPAGATLTFVSGISQEPVASARVSVGNTAYTTDGAGQIRLGQPADLGASLSIDAAGFLRRDTLIRGSADSVFTLWPLEDEFGYYTHELAYAFGGLRRFHPSTRRVSIVPSADFLANDPLALEAHQYAAERLTAATAGQIEFVVEETATSSIVVASELLPDPCGQFVGCAEWRLDVGYVVGGRIKVSSERSSGNRASLILHELGHIFGLGHIPPGYPQGVMSPEGRAVLDFTSSELRTMHMMLLRQAGTRYPDNDSMVGASVDSSGSTAVIACGP